MNNFPLNCCTQNQVSVKTLNSYHNARHSNIVQIHIVLPIIPIKTSSSIPAASRSNFHVMEPELPALTTTWLMSSPGTRKVRGSKLSGSMLYVAEESSGSGGKLGPSTVAVKQLLVVRCHKQKSQ